MDRFIDIPVERETPEDILERLRSIDPGAELFYAGDGWWWMGVVKPDSERRVAAQLQLLAWENLRQEPPWPVKRIALLKAVGFGLCGKYRFNDGPDFDFIIEDFRKADWIWRNWGTPNKAVQDQIRDSGAVDDEMRLRTRAATIERLAGDERYLFSRLIRKNPPPMPVGVDIT